MGDKENTDNLEPTIQQPETQISAETSNQTSSTSGDNENSVQIRKSSRTVKPSIKAKENQLMVLKADIVDLFNRSIAEWNVFFDEIDDAENANELKQRLAQCEQTKTVFYETYEKISKVGENKVDSTIQELHSNFESEYEHVVESVNERIKSIEMEGQEEEENAILKRKLEESLRKYQELKKTIRQKEKKPLQQTKKTNPLDGRGQLLDETSSQSSGNTSSSSVQVQSKLAEVNFEDRLANSLSKSFLGARIPVAEPGVFKGEFLEFPDWEISFNSYVEDKGLTDNEKLNHLRKYLGEDPSKIVSHCYLLKGGGGYLKAREQLKKWYGSKIRITETFRNKLENWPEIGRDDNTGLRDYSMFLLQCQTAMEELDGMLSLNDYKENKKMTSKLPFWARNKWGDIVSKREKTDGNFPLFHEFVEFVDDLATTRSHPIFEQAGKAEKSNSKGKYTQNRSNHHNKTHSAGKSYSTGYTQADTFSCLYCGRFNHKAAECRELGKQPYAEKQAFIYDEKLCYSCLEGKHFSRECQRPSKCLICNESHPTALHRKQRPESLPKPNLVEKQGKNHSTQSKRVGSCFLSMVVPVYVKRGGSSKEVLTYAALDTQSDLTFISKGTAQLLENQKQKKERLRLSTLHGTTSEVRNVYQLSIRGYNTTEQLNVKAYEQRKLSYNAEQIPAENHTAQFEHLRPIRGLIPPLLDLPVGLLIGLDCAEAFIQQETIVGGRSEPFAVKTLLGWTLCGGRPTDGPKTSNRIQVEDVEDILRDNHKDGVLSQTDIRFIEIMKDQTTIDQQGHVEMPLPFSKRPSLPDNKEAVMKRFHGLEKRFKKDHTYEKHYKQFMADIIEAGDAELIPEGEEIMGEIWYIPHFGVYHPRKPGKIRVVFDCSAEFAGENLNHYLLQGPDLLNNLTGVLCRFRRHPIAITSDIQKMFHQFKLKPSDRNYLRFLWYDAHGNVTSYRMCVHLFGATSSPGCASYGLRKLADDNVSICQEASQFLKDDVYMDDGLLSVETVEEGKQLIEGARAICAKGNLRLHKFLSNNREILSSIPKSEQADSTEGLDLSHDELPTTSTLGLKWNPETDKFFFSSRQENKPRTRRGVMSVIAQVFDPLGLLSPFILQGRLVQQEVCSRGLEMDEVIGDDLKLRWENWTKQLQNLESVQIDRCVKPRYIAKATRTELHHFCDGSSTGYGACSYIRHIDEAGQVHCALLMGKARVVPKNPMTIPRVELQAALTAARMSSMLKDELKVDVDSETFWTDSKVVLGYLNNDAKRFKIFVANRVAEIHSLSDRAQWHYVNTADNVADITSRGCDIKQLMKSQWFRGPDFLWNQGPITDPDSTVYPHELSITDAEIKHVKMNRTSKTGTWTQITGRFSSWSRLIKAVAQLKSCIRQRKWRFQHSDTSILEDAEKFVLQKVQEEYFVEEFRSLGDEKPISNNSPIKALDPILQDGIIKVGGRARHSPNLTQKEIHPIIIPKGSILSKLIVGHFHGKTFHQGRSTTQALIRSAGFWIVGSSKAVCDYIHNCTTCRKLRRPSEGQKMADLPADRLEPSPPFTHIGVDTFGPFHVKDRRSELKRYGLVITCLYSRAIHIEMMDDLSTDEFINALRRLISVRGSVRVIRCDNGTNFIGAENALKAELKSAPLKPFTDEQQITFKFNPPNSSHFGGVWERQIRTIRSVLNGIMLTRKHRLTSSTLRTVFCEITTIINSRPISVEDLNDPFATVITPNHLLTMKGPDGLAPAGDFNDETYSRHQWKRAQEIADTFWKTWKSQYLTNIMIRQKWRDKKSNLKQWDIVLSVDDNLPRLEWRLGRVKDVKTSNDGLIRSVTVETQSTVLTRPIHKLVVVVEA